MSTRPAASGSFGRFHAALRESPPLLWSFLYFFCLLTGYYVLRPVREAMGASSDVTALFPPSMIAFFAERGIALKELQLQVLFTCTFLIMLALQPAYGWLVSRWPRRVFLPAVYGFFIGTLLLFYVAFDSGMPGRGMAFFLWITVFNLFAVAVFWSFMADVFSDAEARRCYGYIGAAGTVGAILGPTLARMLVERIGIANLMLVSAGFLVLCVVCLLRLRQHAVRREAQRQLASGEVPMGGTVLAGLRLIVGLGNPGAEHARTRHNAGFWFIDALAAAGGARFGLESKLHGETAKLSLAGQNLLLLKPATFMNLSGRSLGAALRYWKIEPEECLVAHDELDLPPGAARLKFDGGHGGQNGLRDTMRLLGHGKFYRLRIGIGHPGHKDKVTPWVLGKPGRDDEATILRAIDDAIDVMPLAVQGNVMDAMTRLHTPRPQ